MLEEGYRTAAGDLFHTAQGNKYMNKNQDCSPTTAVIETLAHRKHGHKNWPRRKRSAVQVAAFINRGSSGTRRPNSLQNITVRTVQNYISITPLGTPQGQPPINSVCISPRRTRCDGARYIFLGTNNRSYSSSDSEPIVSMILDQRQLEFAQLRSPSRCWSCATSRSV